MSTLLELLRASSAFSGGNAAFIENLYERYLHDPNSVSEAWRNHFDQLKQEVQAAVDIPHGPIRDSFARLAREHPGARPSDQCIAPAAAEKQAAVLRLINAYRVRGHQHASIDPLQLREMEEVPDLDPSFHGLDANDMETVFNTGSLFAGDRLPLREIIAFSREAYCGNLGAEYMHITDTIQKRWIQERVEGHKEHLKLGDDDRRWLLTLLTAAEGIEKYLHTRYVGQKRFSLEGGESLIPLLDELIQRAGANGIKETAIGMAHRGRLNVLVNILGKPPGELFEEFEGRKKAPHETASGDVKYHMGFSTDIETPGGITHVTLGFNPSHLEIINPVTQGSVRARQRRRLDHSGDQVLPIVIHGDAAFAGQGVVMETLNMSQARGFTTGGTVHVIINNQIGFTTSNPMDVRSTFYCTDVAKMVEAPIFHVNGDDPEAVIFITRLALDYRMRFKRDVVIDLFCYRRHGHNEADEPAVTQPLLYKKIRSHSTTRTRYADRLIAQGLITPEQGQQMTEAYRTALDQGRVVSRAVVCGLKDPHAINWNRFNNVPWEQPAKTAVKRKTLAHISERLLALPEGLELHPRIAKIIDERRKMAAGDQLLDWGMGETLAYATLLTGGTPVRLSGQDSGRGTFFHRHAVLHNQADGEPYVPLQHLCEEQADFRVIDSLLSEEAVLGFEYGYATTDPHSLVLWEAQFGDFANGAQVVIDQFITSAWAKWGLHCGLVLLLPHGYEGQGPEHSSARIERYLQLCAEHNIQLCIPTTPAQVFHMLRRQIIRPYRRPLVVMTPKSLLRHRLATSPLEAFTDGAFQPIITELEALAPKEVERIIFCTGKVYYDLLEARQARGLKNAAIIRVEQLYPFPREAFAQILQQFPHTDELIWCQEEPQNQGAWDQIKHRFHTQLDAGKQLYYVGRAAAASPAAGQHSVHIKQQETLVDEALTGRINPKMNRRTSP
jgi:2-oxoglutarate dehydrogenase E1 component